MLKFYYRFKVWKLRKDIEYYKEIAGGFNKYKQDELSDYLAKLGIQRTFCYCSKCNNELIGSHSFVSDEEYVTYKCTECGNISIWDFDGLCPILLED